MPKAVWPLLKLTERQHHSPSQVNSDEIPFKLAEPHTPLPPQEIGDGFRRQISPNRRVTCCGQEVAYTPLHRIQETGGRLRTIRSNQGCCPHKTKPPPHPPLPSVRATNTTKQCALWSQTKRASWHSR